MELIRTTRLPPTAQKTLWQSVLILERESFIGRVAELTGEPITQLMRYLPAGVTRRINDAVQAALTKALDVALYRLDSDFPEPGLSGFKLLSGITGGVSGFLGLATLPLELPVTTTLMLRSIANIARQNGETLNNIETQLACLEVFALGPSRNAGKAGPSAETSYYAVRTFLARSVSQAAEALAERGLAQRSAPLIVELVSSIGSRFGLVVSDKVAAGAIPIVGAVGGAMVNFAFMDHFQRLARAHFAVRRLERQFGQDETARLYAAYLPLARRPNSS